MINLLKNLFSIFKRLLFIVFRAELLFESYAKYFAKKITGSNFKKRSDKNNATFAVGGFAGVIDEAILQPIGVELRGDNEHLIWSQFTRAPTKSY